MVQGALRTSKEFRPCLCHQRAQVCPAGTAPRVHHSLAASGRKPRCHGEMLADQHGFAHNRLCCIGGSFSDYRSSHKQVFNMLQCTTSCNVLNNLEVRWKTATIIYRIVIPAKGKSHGRMYSSFGMPKMTLH